MLKAVTVEEVIHDIRQAYRVLEPFEVYYGLAKLNLPRITETTKEVVRWCVAIQSQQLPITIGILTYVTGKNHANACRILHRLGDNKILTLIRGESRCLRYVLHPRVCKVLDPKIVAQRIREVST